MGRPVDDIIHYFKTTGCGIDILNADASAELIRDNAEQLWHSMHEATREPEDSWNVVRRVLHDLVVNEQYIRRLEDERRGWWAQRRRLYRIIARLADWFRPATVVVGVRPVTDSLRAGCPSELAADIRLAFDEVQSFVREEVKSFAAPLTPSERKVGCNE